MNEVERTDLTDLIGQTIVKIHDNTEFELKDGRYFYFWHYQDCCENVDVDEVTGDIEDMLDTPILVAYETTSEGDSRSGSLLFTFYHFRTNKGDVCIRWRGESNGYYGVSVSYGFKRRSRW